jgi:hypothetical protein
LLDMARSQRRDGAAKVDFGACLHGLSSSKLKTEGWRGDRHAGKRLDDKHFHLNKSQNERRGVHEKRKGKKQKNTEMRGIGVKGREKWQAEGRRKERESRWMTNGVVAFTSVSHPEPAELEVPERRPWARCSERRPAAARGWGWQWGDGGSIGWLGHQETARLETPRAPGGHKQPPMDRGQAGSNDAKGPSVHRFPARAQAAALLIGLLAAQLSATGAHYLIGDGYSHGRFH